MDGHLDIIKQLVDSLTMQLTNILMRVESINPLLTRLQQDLSNDSRIDQDTLNQVKQLKMEIDTYHNPMSDLPKAIERIESIEADVAQIKQLMGPVNKIARFILKPISAILFLLTTSGAILAIIEAVHYFFSKST